MAIEFDLQLAKNDRGEPVVPGDMRVRRVDRRTCISDEIIDGPLSGWWIDLLDGSGRVLYRRLIDDPFRGAEVPRDESGELVSLPSRNVAAVRAVLPDIRGANTVVVMQDAGRDRAAVPLYRAALPAGR